MVSALNPQLGTQESAIGQTATGQIVYRRVTGTAPGGAAGQPKAPASSSPALQVVGRALLVVGLAAAGVVLVAGVVAFSVGALTAGVLGGGRQRPTTKADI
jgi:hypothetical protein